VTKLKTVVDALGVTAPALKWRLAALHRISRARAQEIPGAALRDDGRRGVVAEPMPPLLSKPFAEVIAHALDDVRLSARKAADLLDRRPSA
jgi:hypothetical protein